MGPMRCGNTKITTVSATNSTKNSAASQRAISETGTLMRGLVTASFTVSVTGVGVVSGAGISAGISIDGSVRSSGPFNAFWRMAASSPAEMTFFSSGISAAVTATAAGTAAAGFTGLL